MATVNAAKAGKVPGRERGLAQGDHADFVELSLTPRFEVLATWVGGERVWSKAT